MKYEWTKNKYLRNLAKHKVRFEDAKTIFSDLSAVEKKQFRNGELRWKRIGLNPDKGLLTVVYTESEKVIRIITAWKSTKTEAGYYEKGFNDDEEEE